MDVRTFVKGMVIGICGLIPGISGGTIAFITGIYSRLIHDIKNVLSFTALYSIVSVSVRALVYPSRRNRQQCGSTYKTYDVYFLGTLLLGALLAGFLGSTLILFLLEDYFIATMMFFIGLVFSSSFLIYNHIRTHDVKSRLFAVLGLLLGALTVVLVPVSVSVTPLYLFFSGFISSSALLLPGISGSYWLYILGVYELILQSINQLLYTNLIVMGVGIVCGLFFISRVIVFLLDKYHAQTLYFLFGFVLGALLIPIRNMLNYGFTDMSLLFGVCFFFVGFGMAFVLQKLDVG